MASSLSIEGVSAAYGAVRVLEDISMGVGSGETVALLGTNGNGKSTLIKCVMGIVRPTSGSITAEIDGKRHQLVGKTTEAIVDLGIALVPEGRRLFPKLTVEENLLLGAFRPMARAHLKKNLAYCLEAFPVLAERRGQLAGSMSGGEQQMLALARALMSAPRILLVDEPSVGLAPLLVRPSERAHGRAELHPGDQDRRSRLRHRPRQDRLRRPLRRRAQQQRADPEVLPGAVGRLHWRRASFDWPPFGGRSG